MRVKKILSVVSAFLFPVLFAGVVVFVLGYDPKEAYTELINGAFIGKLNIGTTLERFGPILFTALAFAITFKAKFFNLGNEGAFYIGAIVAAGIGQIKGLPAIIHIPFTLLCGIICGAIWIAVPGALRAFYDVNEAASTILLNFVAILLSEYLIMNPWQEVIIASGRSKTIEASAQFAKILRPSRLSSGIFILIPVFILVYWLVHKTRFGFKLKSTGLNPFFASYVGFNVKKTIIIATAISGGISGLAGSIDLMGVNYLWLKFSTGVAFDGMLAALIAGNDIKMIPLTAFMIAAFQAGAKGMERFTGIPKSMIDMFVPLLIILLSVREFYDLSNILEKIKDLLTQRKKAIEDK